MEQHIGRLYVYGDESDITDCLLNDPVLSRLQGLELGQETFNVEVSPFEEYPSRGKVLFANDGDLPVPVMLQSFQAWPTLAFTVSSYDPGDATMESLCFTKGGCFSSSGMVPSKFSDLFEEDGDALCESDEAALLTHLERPLIEHLGVTPKVMAPTP